MIIFLIILKIYSSWFSLGKALSAGDWPYLFLENIREFSFWPKAPFLWLEPYYQLTAKIFVERLGFSWELTEKIFWFWPFLLLAIFSSRFLTKSYLGSLVYTTNTYILMLVGGGQTGVAMAYALAPYILRKFMEAISFSNSGLIKNSLVLGVVLAIQLMFDPRIFLLSLLICGLYFLYILFLRKIPFLLPSLFFLITIFLSLFLNLFWILPFVNSGLSPFSQGKDIFLNSEVVKYFSFATFSNSFSLVHPNWPENIFGKIYFQRPEFLVLPILAFSSLLFVNAKHQKIIFFSFLALLGAFLSKGANPPFGFIYLWLFDHLPGFLIFRDPTKFYLLTCLAYSVLLPQGLFRLRENLKWPIKIKKLKLKTNLQNFLFFLFVCFWLFTVKEAVLGQVGGTFIAKEVPKEYVQFKEFLRNQPQFSRTFWVTKRQRFGFSSLNHPSIDASFFFEAISDPEIISWLKSENSLAELKSWQVKYLIVPFDSEGEIFLKDWRYSREYQEKVEREIQTISWLRPLSGWGRIAVFEIVE